MHYNHITVRSTDNPDSWMLELYSSSLAANATSFDVKAFLQENHTRQHQHSWILMLEDKGATLSGVAWTAENLGDEVTVVIKSLHLEPFARTELRDIMIGELQGRSELFFGKPVKSQIIV